MVRRHNFNFSKYIVVESVLSQALWGYVTI